MRDGLELNIQNLRLRGGPEPLLLRAMVAVFLLGMAGQAFLDRYDFLHSDHGFMVGADYVNTNIGIPLQWLAIGPALPPAGIACLPDAGCAGVCLCSCSSFAVPALVSALYVKPNEIRSSAPTSSAHPGHPRRLRPRARAGSRVPRPARRPHRRRRPAAAARQRPPLGVAAVHDTITQLQALRPYYIFRQRHRPLHHRRPVPAGAPLAARARYPPAPRRARHWNNPRFIYTHGYGLVLADVSQITADGLPVSLVETRRRFNNAKPQAHPPRNLLRRRYP